MSNTSEGDGDPRRVSSTSRTPPAGRPAPDMGTIAKVSVSQIVGLVEAIDEVGGQADVATIAQEVEMDLDRIGPIVDAAEFLGLLSVVDGDLRLNDRSRRLLQARVKERKAIVRDVIEDVPVFRHITNLVRSAGRPLDRAEVVAALAEHVGSHHAEDFFRALVYWGRYVELVQYDSEAEQLRLRTPST